MRRFLLPLVLLVAVLAGCSSGGGVDAQSASSAGDEMVAREAAGADDGAPAAPADAPEGGEAQGGAAQDGDAPGGDAATGEQGGVGTGDAVSLPEAPPVAPGDRVIKEGTVVVEVEAGAFDRAFAAVVAAARRAGGDVVASDTRTGDDGTTSGSVTVRVPVRAYEDLLVGVADIGTVRSRTLDAEDVSAEFVDLESRLRHLEAQERFYLGLMEDAETIEDAIAVQQRLDTVQAEKEQVQGRLRYLDDRTSFSTLTVELFETGAAVPVADATPAARPTLARYWDTARDAFVNVLGILLVVAVFAAPLLVLAGAGAAVWRLVTRDRRVAPPASPPPPADERRDEPVGAPPA